jgi:hypothetical protein
MVVQQDARYPNEEYTNSQEWALHEAEQGFQEQDQQEQDNNPRRASSWSPELQEQPGDIHCSSRLTNQSDL